MIETLGAVDIHFHGAFGIDLMSARPAQLQEVSERLWQQGVAAFCPTTLSAPPRELAESVEKLGRWIREDRFPGARPLGIHLEGPYLHPDACGAHPPDSIRKLNWRELNHLWSVSQGTLKILTLAPERISPSETRKLISWSRSKRVILSLGHSQATEKQAQLAFQKGFQGVTHAWNALPFHQRSPGALGAALGNPRVYLELIIDQVHVSPTIVRWTLDLHPTQSICFISDCINAKGKIGSHSLQFKDGACRLPNGQLAGGGRLLTAAYSRWLKAESARQNRPLAHLFRETIHHLTDVPLRILGVSQRNFRDRRVRWQLKTDKIKLFPIDSHTSNR